VFVAKRGRSEVTMTFVAPGELAESRVAIVDEARKHPDEPLWDLVLRQLAAPYAAIRLDYRDERRSEQPN
jgi:hypothetical protein